MKKQVIYIYCMCAILCSCYRGTESMLTSNTVTVYFKNYEAKPFKTLGGMSHIDMPKVAYVDSSKKYVAYIPKTDCDTLVIPCFGGFAELGLNYRNFEFHYPLLIQGDTVVITQDNNDFPVINSRHYPERNHIYNIDYQLRKGRTFQGIEPKAGLVSFRRIAENIDFFRKNKLDRFLSDYCSIDTLQYWFDSYQQAYQDTINKWLQNGEISQLMFQRYEHLHSLNRHTAHRYVLNRRQALKNYYLQMEIGLKDEYVVYPSYQEYLNYYFDYLCADESIRINEESSKECTDYKLVFDTLAAKKIPQESKRILLAMCMNKMAKTNSSDDVSCYLKRFLEITSDTAVYQHIMQECNISVNAKALVLEKVNGMQTTFDALLERHIGKVIYVDFWASWCSPCRDEMQAAATLRDSYKGKDVAFIYLAYNDEMSKWKQACNETGLFPLSENYFIVNSVNNAVLDQLKLKTIPRYLIFDKKGVLKELNAPKPSSKSIYNTLDKYLFQ